MNLLLIPLIVAGAFLLPFGMAWLEQKDSPAHRGPARRPRSR